MPYLFTREGGRITFKIKYFVSIMHPATGIAKGMKWFIKNRFLLVRHGDITDVGDQYIWNILNKIERKMEKVQERRLLIVLSDYSSNT